MGAMLVHRLIHAGNACKSDGLAWRLTFKSLLEKLLTKLVFTSILNNLSRKQLVLMFRLCNLSQHQMAISNHVCFLTSLRSRNNLTAGLYFTLTFLLVEHRHTEEEKPFQLSSSRGRTPVGGDQTLELFGLKEHLVYNLVGSRNPQQSTNKQ